MNMGGEASPTSTTVADSCEITSVTRLLQHVKEPSNLLNYMIFSAYCKYMAVFSWIPTITIGG